MAQGGLPNPGKRPPTVYNSASKELRSRGVAAEGLEIWTYWAPERGDGGDHGGNDDGDGGGDDGDDVGDGVGVGGGGGGDSGDAGGDGGGGDGG